MKEKYICEVVKQLEQYGFIILADGTKECSINSFIILESIDSIIGVKNTAMMISDNVNTDVGNGVKMLALCINMSRCDSCGKFYCTGGHCIRCGSGCTTNHTTGATLALEYMSKDATKRSKIPLLTRRGIVVHKQQKPSLGCLPCVFSSKDELECNRPLGLSCTITNDDGSRDYNIFVPIADMKQQNKEK